MTTQEIKNGLFDQAGDKEALANHDDTSVFAYDAQVLKEAAKYIEELEDRINRQPAIDAEPVRRGKWEEHLNYMQERDGYYWCPLCRRMATREYDYCPNCGAKMDLEGDE